MASSFGKARPRQLKPFRRTYGACAERNDVSIRPITNIQLYVPRVPLPKWAWTNSLKLAAIRQSPMSLISAPSPARGDRGWRAAVMVAVHLGSPVAFDQGRLRGARYSQLFCASVRKMRTLSPIFAWSNK